MVKISKTTIQVNLCSLLIIKIFTISLPSQPFLGCHLGPAVKKACGLEESHAL